MTRNWRGGEHIEGLHAIFSHGTKDLVDHGHLIIEVSRSYSDTPHSVGLLWTSDQPDAETST